MNEVPLCQEKSKMNFERPMKFNLARKKKQDELHKAYEDHLSQKKEAR